MSSSGIHGDGAGALLPMFKEAEGRQNQGALPEKKVQEVSVKALTARAELNAAVCALLREAAVVTVAPSQPGDALALDTYKAPEERAVGAVERAAREVAQAWTAFRQARGEVAELFEVSNPNGVTIYDGREYRESARLNLQIPPGLELHAADAGERRALAEWYLAQLRENTGVETKDWFDDTFGANGPGLLARLPGMRPPEVELAAVRRFVPEAAERWDVLTQPAKDAAIRQATLAEARQTGFPEG